MRAILLAGGISLLISLLGTRYAIRQFTRLGELASGTGPPVNDGCKVSCVDWYGNTRPLILSGRILALLGYELVEVVLEADAIREVRRTSFAPVPSTTTLRD